MPNVSRLRATSPASQIPRTREILAAFTITYYLIGFHIFDERIYGLTGANCGVKRVVQSLICVM